MFRFPKRDEETTKSSKDRLDSWKEIAAYLRRDASTARRWEKTENLPVHRHVHEKLSTVYAYRSELDAWWHNRRDHLEEIDRTLRPTLRRKLSTLAGITATMLILTALFWWVQERGLLLPPGGLDFVERDWVLIAHFENRTGEPLFEGTLEAALARELSNSLYVNVIPRQRVDNVLRLMKRPLDTELNADLAREICLRDGGIKAFLTGRVEKLGSTYVLSASLSAVSDGRVVAGQAEKAQGLDEIWPAIRALSRWARLTLGETLPLVQHNGKKLEKVTTPSLKALQLFSQGEILLRRREHAPAAELFKRALEEDPDLAAAHVWLAWALKSQGLPEEMWLPHAEKAAELSENVSETERYMILAKYYSIRGYEETAIPYYEALLQLDPDHYWGTNDLYFAYSSVGRREEAVQLAIRLADLRPNDFSAQLLAAVTWIRHWRDHDRARHCVERARQLISPEVMERHPGSIAWLETYPALELWAAGKVRDVFELAKALEATLGHQKGEIRDLVALNIGAIHFALGRCQKARDLYQEGNYQIGDWLLTAYETRATSEVEDTPKERDRIFGLYARDKRASPVKVFVAARTGRLPLAREMLSILEERWSGYSDVLEIVRGEVARAQGQTAQAISSLETGLGDFRRWGFAGLFYLGSESLACALEQQGELRGAVRVLETVSERRARNFEMVDAAFWLKNEWLLARLYHRLGQEEHAQRIKGELLNWLTFADADHPILLDVKKPWGPI